MLNLINIKLCNCELDTPPKLCTNNIKYVLFAFVIDANNLICYVCIG